jgi:predicted nucleic acid-binding Zn ribbon protein
MSRIHSRNIICVVCGKEFFDKNARRKTCSQQCHHELVSRNAKNNHVNSNRISKSCKAFMESKNLSYDESINLIIHMYSIEKMSVSGLNKETGLSKNFIRRILQDNNVSIVHSKEKNILSDDVKESIQQDYRHHIDINSVKKKYHLSYRKIRDCLNS